MTTILLNCITIAMETTSLRSSIPMFFISTDAIFLGIFFLEFILKVEFLSTAQLVPCTYATGLVHFQVYAQPLGYWKNNYNLFDFAVLVVSLVHEILLGVELGGNGVTFLRMAAGESHCVKFIPTFV